MNEREKRQMAVSTLRRAGREQEAAELEQEGKRGNKYGAEKTKVDGIVFDSKAESERYLYWKARLDGKTLLGFIRQPVFYLPGGTRYVADFMLWFRDDSTVVEDVKGHATAEFRVKWREVRAAHPWLIFQLARLQRGQWQVSDD